MGILFCSSRACAVSHLLLQQNPAPYTWFVTIAITTAFLAIFFFTTIVAYCRWRRLI